MSKISGEIRRHLNRTFLFYMLKLPSLFFNGAGIPSELKRLFAKKPFISAEAYENELLLFLNQRKIDDYYDFFSIKVCFPIIPVLRNYVNHSFIEFVYPYLFGRDKFNPDVIELESHYYDGQRMFIGKDDVVLDLGAFIGLFTIIAAKEAVNGRVYAFEPFTENTQMICRNLVLNNISNVEVVEKVAWEESKTIKMRYDTVSPSSSGYLYTTENNSRELSAISIDDFVESRKIERVDFIKMDIEGAERYALKGAAETIKKHKPKLSVCTYHLPDDKRLLPEIIKSIRPDYTIKMKKNKLYAY